MKGRAGVWAGAVLILAAVLGVAALDRALAALDLLTPAMALHGALMLVAWGALMPAGGVLARYFKVTPRQDFPASLDNLFWFDWHRVLQYASLALSTLATGVILGDTAGHVNTLHGGCGLLVMALAWLQVLSTFLRGTKGGPTDRRADPSDPATWRGDHYDMTPRRLRFEAWHKPAGWTAIVLAGVTILLGIDLIGAPAWLTMTVGLLQGGAVLAAVDGSLRRRWVDTYAALWGYDARHPGNRSPPDAA